MTRPIPRLALFAGLAVTALAAPAWAQPVPAEPAAETPAAESPQAAEARAIFRASAEAIKLVEGFAASFSMTGDGSAMIKNNMPNMSGRIYFGRTEAGPVMHAVGEAKENVRAEAAPFDILRTKDTATWVDTAAEKIAVRRALPEPRDMPTPLRMLYLASMLQDDPYAAGLARAGEITMEGTKPVGSEPCHVILIKFDENIRPARGGPTTAHTSERWFISTRDNLPRRLEMVTDMESLGFSIVTEMTDLTIGAQPPEMLDVPRPDGYTVDDTTAPAVRVETPTRDASPRTREPAPEPAAPAAPPAPARNLAPSFSFTPEGGDEVSNDTQAGRVTVLYFWGTWCIPCRALSPRISELAERFGDRPVDVFAPAIRERDPEAPRSYMAEQDYRHRLVLGADRTASAFKVRIYPTVVVIGPDNELLYEAYPTKERTPEALAAEVADAIEAALP